MKIGGYVPVSLCDFPGRVAAVVFTRGCNFRCPFCHNGHLVETAKPGAGDLPPGQVLARLTARRAHLGGVVISGGEPTLQPGLPAFLAELRALGLAVKLDTNGSSPEVLRQLLDARLVDYVAMDIKATWSGYARLSGVPCDVPAVRRSVALIAGSGLPHEFRTTFVPGLHTEDDLVRIPAQIPPGSPHRWQAFRAGACLDPRLCAGRPQEASPTPPAVAHPSQA